MGRRQVDAGVRSITLLRGDLMGVRLHQNVHNVSCMVYLPYKKEPG